MSIAPRFCGPPHSGNGGYVCGLVAADLGPAACVRLRLPPPLSRPLRREREGAAVRLLDGDSLVATGRVEALDLSAPRAPTLEQAVAASRGYVGHRHHPFPGCFVCGPDRAHGDGLRIFPGRVAGRELVAAPWTPSPDLADAAGTLHEEFVWSALDCTGYFAFAPLDDGAPALLGELTARIDGEVRAGEPHIAAGWPIGADGRKRFAGSAVYHADGSLLAVARATWIVVAHGSAGAAQP